MAEPGGPSIRAYRPEDLEALYGVCLRTGAAGEDATDLFTDPRLLGDLYVAPYAALEPEHAYVLDDGSGAVHGYVVGARDTRAFEARCEAAWWPAARARHAAPEEADGLDALFLAVLSQPIPAAEDVVARYPSHLHIDLLPAFQGQGWGRRLLDVLLGSLRAAGSTGVHLGVAEANTRAIAFYERLGMEELGTDGFTRTYGLRL